MPKLLSVTAFIFFLAIHAPAQTAAPRLAFDIVVIHPADPAAQNGFIKAMPSGQGYTAQNMTVKIMISLMYKVPQRQIKGGPDWLGTERFDVEAKADQPYNIDDLHTMYQNLLIDRFGLRFHKEVKEGPVYALTVDPSGLKMKPDTTPQDFKIPVTGAPQHFTGVRVPMTYLTWFLGQILQDDARPVINQTGLDGNYDWDLRFAPILPPDAAANPEATDLPNIFVALKDQLGLKLTAQKGPIEYYVIDSIEKPSSN